MAAKGMRKEVIVVGAGVAGLSCGVRLLERGFGVHVIAREFSPHTTSDVAAAVWHPYLAAPENRVRGWGSRAYEAFRLLATDPATGVSFVPMLELFSLQIPLPWWGTVARGFRAARTDELPPGYVVGHLAEIPRIDTPIYMQWLVDRYHALGGTTEQREIRSLQDVAPPGRIIVHCPGAWAFHTVGDARSMPVRGQIVRIAPVPGVTRCIFDESDPFTPTYIIPRRHDCILGGSAERGEWRLAADPALTERILASCTRLEPALRDAKVLDVRVGLRPGRDEVRLEAETTGDGSVIVHNYGHGGAGFTLSWGCADEVASLVEAHVRSMALMRA